MILRSVLCGLLILAETIFCMAQQPEARKEGSISGRVVTEDGQPVPNAVVMLDSRGQSLFEGRSHSGKTDAEGSFAFNGLGPRAYHLSAMAPGLVSPENTRNQIYRIGDTVMIRLVKGGVITGRVTDEYGQPMVGYAVSARKVDEPLSEPHYAEGVLNSRETDDRGIFRLFGLPPGKYIVGVNVRVINSIVLSSPMSNAPAVYFPSATRRTAPEINVRNGDEINGIDIQYRILPGHSISGTLSGDIESSGMVNMLIVVVRDAVTQQEVATKPIMGSAKFVIPHLEDGDYLMEAYRGDESQDAAYAPPIRISLRGADVSGVNLKLAKLASVSGKVLVEKETKPASVENACSASSQYSLEEVLVSAKRADGRMNLSGIIGQQQLGIALPDKTGAFTMKGVEPGLNFLTVDPPNEGVYVQSILKRIATNTPPVELHRTGITTKTGEIISGVELKLAPGAAKLSGKLVAANNAKSLPEYLRIHLAPVEAAAAGDLLRHYEVRPINGDGFEFKNVAPGKYWLLARPIKATEPNRLAAWDSAERMMLRREAESSKVEIELKPCQQLKEQILKVGK